MSSKHRQLIGGEWVEATGGKWFAVTNPASGERVGEVPDSSEEDARLAIKAAHEAFRPWAAMPAQKRAALLRRFGDLIVKNADRLASTLTAEQGKPLAEAKGEILSGAEYLYWYAEESRRIYGETIPAHSPRNRITVLRQPVGVVAAITPWNFPSSMITRKLAPALAAGCTVVIKPAEQTPLSALLIGELAQEAGLPPGVVNIVTTMRPERVGQEFLGNPLVRKLSFTGSTEVGRYLYQGAANQLKRVSLELGGHAPFIIFADADLDAAVQGAVSAKFLNAGQACICANRYFVEESILEAFLERFAAKVGALRVGRGDDPATRVGPLIDQAALEKVEAHVADACGKGARVAVGGHRLLGPGYDQGFFYAPTVLADTKPGMQVVHEETFGPVAPVLSFKTEAEVVAMANDTEYGLASYVYTRDLGRSVRVSEALEYGMVAINDTVLGVPQAPFGGVKQSGMGREGGHHGLDGFLEYKYVSVRLND